MPSKKKPDHLVSKRALRLRRQRAKETPKQRRARLDKMAERMRDRKRQRNRSRKRTLPQLEMDAINSGASIVNENELRRPFFIVITPQGRRIETLEPDLI